MSVASINLVIVMGRVVHYVLSKADVEKIRAQRRDMDLLYKGRTVVHGNAVSEGDHVPMIITNVCHPEREEFIPSVNGQCFLDGMDRLWVTSAKHDTSRLPGTWHWMERDNVG